MNGFQNNASRSKLFLLAAIACSAISLAVFLYTLYSDFRSSNKERGWQQSATELRVMTHKISARSNEAVDGSDYAFAQLANTTKQFESKFQELLSGSDSSAGLPDSLSSEVKVLQDKWRYIQSDTDKIMLQQDAILLMHAVASQFESSLEEIGHETERASKIVAKRAAVEQLLLIQKQNLLAHKLSTAMNALLAGDLSHKEFVTEFKAGANEFNQITNGLLRGDALVGIKKLTDVQAVESLKQIQSNFGVINESFNRIIAASPNVVDARAASGRIIENTPVMLTATNVLLDAIAQLPSRRLFGLELALFSAGGVVLGLLAVGWILYRQTVARLSAEQQANDDNQRAIQRLLGEISELADGDLTTEATVSEEFTGAIADSINFTVEQLRGIVSSINDTTKEISGAAENTQSKTLSLADASNAQASEILQASSSIKEMAGTMSQMSEEAARSSTVAKSSVEIAKSGANVVKNAIVGMDSIRDQIQDTSKRIKRLGESSQEIGDIVSLITDIADQTNILALNASIQASMAGEAGRGFAVVADEVQRLAERSSSATRQIETLVRAIQSDTNEAVISMEQTTSEVVAGANLTNDAGVALEEIERVSQNIAELVAEISGSASSHADNAAVISNAMDDIKEITSQTASETIQAAESMGRLSGMTVELRESVAGFTLPELVPGSATRYADVPTLSNKRAV